jgi:hypothetical protein
MNWFVAIKLSMALPAAQNYPEPGPRGHRGSLSDIDHRMSDADASQFAERYENLAYLGGGTDGVAYTHSDPQTVVKVTTSFEESEVATGVMGEPSPCCARVFSVDDNENETWTIVVERIQPLTAAQKDAIFQLVRHRRVVDPQLSRQWQQMIRCLKRRGIATSDVHLNNVGFTRDGRLVLFDFGPNESRL